MKCSRRLFVLSGLGFLAGCAAQTTQTSLPGAPWDRSRSVPSPRPTYRPPTPAPALAGASTTTGEGSFTGVISRTSWATGGLIPNRMDPMVGIHRITVHHDGMSACWATGERDCAARIDMIRRAHQSKGWGDIGYHFVVDRAGRVWEGRPLQYQGAHVKDHNEQNIGVVCLGNFEIQDPSQAQIEALLTHLRTLMGRYRIPVRSIYTHQELKPTLCPGRSLQRTLVNVRGKGMLA